MSVAAIRPATWNLSEGVPRWATTAIGIAALLLVWEILIRQFLGGRYIIATPSAIVVRIVEDRELFGRALWTTLVEAFWGFLFGNLAAVALAALVAIVPRSERLVQGIALVVFCLPLVATGPILRVLYGPGVGPQITLAALAVYYTTFITLSTGLKAVPATWIDLVRCYGRGRGTALFTVRIRAALPYLVAGLQIAAPAAFLGAMVGEFTGAERGMGVLSIQTMRALDIDGTWALAIIATLVALAVYGFVGWLGDIATPGRPALILHAPPGGRQSAWGVACSVALTAAVILALWQVSMELFRANPFFAKRPLDVFNYLFTSPTATKNQATLLAALGSTVSVIVPGYLLGILTGASLAALFNLLPLVGRVATPIAIALRSIPIIATAPLIVLALGRDLFSTVVIVAVMIFFPTFVACSQGLKQTPGQVIDVFDSFSAGRLRTLLLARLPAMLPALFAAARMAVPSAVLAASVAEWLATGTGIGNLMALTASTSAYGMLWSAVVALTLVSIGLFAIVVAVERLVLSRFAPEQVAP